jgi:malonyl CoA-acyl carrier protein transacylase
MLAFIFPGQGSQVKGMGGSLFDEYLEITQTADEILGYSIKTLCLQDPEQKLNQTQFTQPALFTVNALMYFKKLNETQIKPDIVAGHSLGEYNALLAANVFSFETGLTLVKKRGELMSQAKEGSMAAILGINIDVIKKILDDNNLSNIAIANYNSYTQTVISGINTDIEAAGSLFKKIKEAAFFPLKVSGAFHSPYMQNAKQDFFEFIKNFTFNVPTLPVIANCNALPYHPGVIHANLSNQMTDAVQWTSIIECVNTYQNINIEEMGPGNVLKGLLLKIAKGQ